MYYRKYFSGEVDATTTTTRYWMGLDKSATTTRMGTGHILNRSNVIGNALVSTFKDIGYTNAYWDSTSGYFFIDKTNSLCGFYISIQSTSALINYGYYDGSTAYLKNGAGSTTLNATNNPFQYTGVVVSPYAFYITIIGEPTGLMKVHIGSYSTHGYTSGLGFYVGRGTDKRDNSPLFLSHTTAGVATSISSLFALNYETAGTVDNTTSVTEKSFLSGTNKMIMIDEAVVLIPLILLVGYVVLDNTYFNPGLSQGWYEIDGVTYYCDTYWMTKCVTEI